MNTVYQCSYCGELFKHAYQCIDHEKICETNPQNKPCRMCSNFGKLQVVTYKNNRRSESIPCIDTSFSISKRCFTSDCNKCESCFYSDWEASSFQGINFLACTAKECNYKEKENK